MRMTGKTPWRLELSHRSMGTMLLVALFSLGSGVKGCLDGDGGWKTYLGSGLCVAMGLATGLLACNSHVAFDRRTQNFAARHRYLLGTRYSLVDLLEAEAVVINTDSFPGMSLSV